MVALEDTAGAAGDGISLQWMRMKSVLYILAMVCAVGVFTGRAEQQFATPQEAIDSLTVAAKARDTNALNTIFGPDLRQLISPDPVQLSNALLHMSERFSETVVPVTNSESSITLDLGRDAWPFPIPLVKQNDQWHYDTLAGKDEILNRRVGHDELDAIRVCHAYVAAQREYESADQEGDGILQYAQSLRSTPGKHDGLYWHAQPGEETSPLGPLIAQAKAEGYTHATKIMSTNEVPFHGYFYHILRGQGSNAPGGEYNYVINGHMVAGFALVAWPAVWGNTGIMTFIVNQNNRVFEKNLGTNTDEIARAMQTYDPDSSWKPAE